MRIVCTNVDFGDPTPYPDVRLNEWQSVGDAQVLYLKPQDYTARRLAKLVRSTRTQTVYISSLFDQASLGLAAIHCVAGLAGKVIIAPRGELLEGPLTTGSSSKKILAIKFLGVLGLAKKVHWHATSEVEAAGFQKQFPGIPPDRITVAANLPDARREAPQHTKAKEPGKLAVVFCSRISTKKRLELLLGAMAKTAQGVSLDVIGQADEPAFLTQCQEVLAKSDVAARVRFLGPLPHMEIQKRLPGYDLFVLPTMGENYGHAIVEALGAGVRVVITDTTPWSSVAQAGAGHIVEPTEEALARAIDLYAAMPEDQHSKARSAARSYFETTVLGNVDLSGYEQMFGLLAP